MRYRWNRHHSYIVNIVFLNNLVQKQTFFIFCIFVFISYNGSPLGRVSLDGLNTSHRHGTTFLTACATAARHFESFWPRVQLQLVISRVFDRVCMSGAPLFLLFQANRCDHKMHWIQPLRCRSMPAGKRKRAAFQMSGSEYGRFALLLALIWNAKGVCVFLQPWDGTFTFRQKLSKIYFRSNQQLENLLTHK